MPGQSTFPRRERLTHRRDFQQTYKEGRRTASGAFICFVVRQEGQGRKFGLAVSRKVGGAVVRNRVKRFIREVYRARRRHMVDDVVMVVVARPHAASLSYHECANALGRLFREGGVLSE